MTYSEIYKILSFEKTKLITKILLLLNKLSLVVQSSMEPKFN